MARTDAAQATNETTSHQFSTIETVPASTPGGGLPPGGRDRFRSKRGSEPQRDRRWPTSTTRHQRSFRPDRRLLSDKWRQVLTVLPGGVGATGLSIVALWVSLVVAGETGYSLLGLVGMLVAVRVLLYFTRGRRSTLSLPSAIKRARYLVGFELKVCLVLVAATSLAGWHLTAATAVVFVLTDIVLQLVVLSATRLGLRVLTRGGAPNSNRGGFKEIIIIGTGKKARAVADSVADSPDSGLSIKGFLDYRRSGLWRYRDIPLLGHPDELERFVLKEQVDAVVVDVDVKDLLRTRRLFETAEKMGVALYFMPDIFQAHLTRPQLSGVNGSPALIYHAAPSGRRAEIVKNIIDKIGALVGIILSAPLMLLTAVAIKLDSRGPVFFRQERCGVNGKRFMLYKFRTMYNKADKRKHLLKDLNMMSGPVFKAKDDPRVTRIGRILRQCSIDEVPQFFNVLRGDMSLVGPRPPIPSEVEKYQPWQRRRLSVKPGVTCLWQINGRNNIDFERWMELDLEYIDNWSLWLDARILARTLPAVIKGTGAS
ncbi:MAG: sugar transferase [bacterium]